MHVFVLDFGKSRFSSFDKRDVLEGNTEDFKYWSPSLNSKYLSPWGFIIEGYEYLISEVSDYSYI